jgi:hypothetical protein
MKKMYRLLEIESRRIANPAASYTEQTLLASQKA